LQNAACGFRVGKKTGIAFASSTDMNTAAGKPIIDFVIQIILIRKSSGGHQAKRRKEEKT
jgi:hypothetical protein